MSRPAPILDRLRALPLERAPLRRAGVLAVLLVVLLVAGRLFGPSSSGPSVAETRRHDVQAAEASSAPPSAWTAGRFAALLLLASGGGVAALLHRRRAGGAEAPASALETLETHALAGGHSLRLVACGGEVLLLGVGAEGARILRAWPRAAFEADRPAPFADLLAEYAPPRPAPPLTEGGVEVGHSDPLLSLQQSAQSPSPSGGRLGGGRPSDHPAPAEWSSLPGLPPLSPPVQEGDCEGTPPHALDLGGGVAGVWALRDCSVTEMESPPPSGGRLGGETRPTTPPRPTPVPLPSPPPVGEGDSAKQFPKARPAPALLPGGGAALPQFARV